MTDIVNDSYADLEPTTNGPAKSVFALKRIQQIGKTKSDAILVAAGCIAGVLIGRIDMSKVMSQYNITVFITILIFVCVYGLIFMSNLSEAREESERSLIYLGDSHHVFNGSITQYGVVTHRGHSVIVFNCLVNTSKLKAWAWSSMPILIQVGGAQNVFIQLPNMLVNTTHIPLGQLINGLRASCNDENVNKDAIRSVFQSHGITKVTFGDDAGAVQPDRFLNISHDGRCEVHDQ